MLKGMNWLHCGCCVHVCLSDGVCQRVPSILRRTRSEPEPSPHHPPRGKEARRGDPLPFPFRFTSPVLTSSAASRRNNGTMDGSTRIGTYYAHAQAHRQRARVAPTER